MSNQFVVVPKDQTVDRTPIITLDQNTSVLLTDPIGRQTIVSVTPTVPILPNYNPPVLSYPPIMASRYEYQDLNEDSDLHQKVMKKIYTNIYNFIIPNEYPYLLNYIKKGKNDYTMVKSMNEYKKNKTRESEYENKLQYIARNVYTKVMMYSDVKQYLDTYDIKWYDIEDRKRDIYNIIIMKLKRKLEDLVK